MAAPSPSSTTIPLTPHEALSGISGSISLAAWLFLLLPQLLENYARRSAAGVSVAFLCVWAAGDAANLAGALRARLVPTVVALAAYFCAADALLLAQCAYYNLLVNGRWSPAARRRRREEALAERAKLGADGGGDEEEAVDGGGEQEEDGEMEPLLRRRTSSTMTAESNVGLPGSQRRRSSSGAGSRRRRSDRRDSIGLASILEENSRGRAAWVKNTLCILLVCAAGTAGWALAWRGGVWTPTPSPSMLHGGDGDGTDGREPNKAPLDAEVLGYISAVLYLGARVPQIIKNQRARSCDGLSLLFFLLSLLGNATYGAGILFHSLEREYLLTNLPWLLGSLGTMVEDAIIFAQFHAFGDKSEQEAVQ